MRALVLLALPLLGLACTPRTSSSPEPDAAPRVGSDAGRDAGVRDAGAVSTSSSSGGGGYDAAGVALDWSACLSLPDGSVRVDGGDAGCVMLNVTTLAGGSRGKLDGDIRSSRFYRPRGLAVSGVRVFVADELNNALRLVNVDAGTVSTLSGSTAGHVDGTLIDARFRNPRALVFHQDVVFVADEGNAVIRRADLVTGEVTTLAGGVGVRAGADGIGELAAFNGLTDLALSPDGATLYVADQFNQAIRAVDVATRSVTTLTGALGDQGAEDGPLAEARFFFPTGVAVSPDGDTLFVADQYNHTIREVDLVGGVVRTLAGRPGIIGEDDGDTGVARFNYPSDVVTDGHSVMVADQTNLRIRRIDLASRQVITLAGESGGLTITLGPSDVTRLYPPLTLSFSDDGRGLYFTMDRVHGIYALSGLPRDGGTPSSDAGDGG